MTSWATTDLALLSRWVEMVAPLVGAGEPDAAIASALDWEIQRDLAERDRPHVGELIEEWALAMCEAAVEIRQAMR